MFIIYLGILSSLSETFKYLFDKFRSDDNIPSTNTSLHGGINESHILQKIPSPPKRNSESEIFSRVKRDEGGQGTGEKGKGVVEASKFNIDFLKY